MANITFGEFTPAEKVNPYADAIKSLSEAPENTAMAIEWDADDVAKEHLKVQKAANAINRTAKKVGESTSKDGKKVTYTFLLVAKHKPRRGSK
jgi:hypothetical protein